MIGAPCFAVAEIVPFDPPLRGTHRGGEVREPVKSLARAGEFIPGTERWLHEPDARARLDRALRWAEEHPETTETDLGEFERRLAE